MQSYSRVRSLVPDKQLVLNKYLLGGWLRVSAVRKGSRKGSVPFPFVKGDIQGVIGDFPDKYRTRIIWETSKMLGFLATILKSQ